MTDESEQKPAVRHFTDLELFYIGKYLPEMRASLTDQRLLKQSLIAALVLGLGAHIVGYLIKSAAPGEPIALLADLLYALGFALWTAVVVVAFIELYPAVKRRQYIEAIREYEAVMGKRAGDDAPTDG